MNYSATTCWFWMGCVVGVNFIATPAKFLAPQLSLTDALQVGRATFGVMQWVELAGFGVLVATYILQSRVALITLGLLVSLAVSLGINYLWIRPILDLRVESIIQGHSIAPSSLHDAYIAIEVLKLMMLGILGYALHRQEV